MPWAFYPMMAETTTICVIVRYSPYSICSPLIPLQSGVTSKLLTWGSGEEKRTLLSRSSWTKLVDSITKYAASHSHDLNQVNTAFSDGVTHQSIVWQFHYSQNESKSISSTTLATATRRSPTVRKTLRTERTTATVEFGETLVSISRLLITNHVLNGAKIITDTRAILNGRHWDECELYLDTRSATV